MWRDNDQPKQVRRDDYSPYPYVVLHVSLRFDLDSHKTVVTSELQIERRPELASIEKLPLILDAADLELVSIALDDRDLEHSAYSVEPHSLTVHQPPPAFTLKIVTSIDPANNTALEGLYQSSGNFCTQCEAQGFRKITYFPDRPDVLSTYEVLLVADKSQYPVLLSNGNEIAQGDDTNNRHWVRWHDPHPKPSYLFALVAGQLSVVSDHYVTASGRHVDLKIYVQSHNLEYCDHAMHSLKKAMRWDEDVYGFEYDLDVFMIVAVDDFNMGAMENKGLNVFNSKYVLADSETATDSDFMGIESVIAHEYFHNWTGNRITCRDWFQLSLKEGLTVFRDQEFSSDMNSRAVKRVEDVRLLRARQFPEDAGPMAHPIRPDSYIEINNFYTVTIYEKGAEVIRMMHTLLGSKMFFKGIGRYVERHDGEAATCDQFVAAMHDASGMDLSQFKHWYSQAGTPVVEVKADYNVASRQYQLTFVQRCAATPGQPVKMPFHIPVRLGLIDAEGNTCQLQPAPESASNGISPILSEDGQEVVLQLTGDTDRFVFDDVPDSVVPSLFRQFSAPVTVEYDYADHELALLLANDTDSFNRWEASQQLGRLLIKKITATLHQSADLEVDREMREDSTVRLFADAFAKTLADSSLDDAQRADILTIPAIELIPDAHEPILVDQLQVARSWLLAVLADHCYDDLVRLASVATDGQLNARAMNQRRLSAACLRLLTALPGHRWTALAVERYRNATSMTDRVAGLSALCETSGEEQKSALSDFYSDFEDNKLVIDKWFALQAAAGTDNVVEQVVELQRHAAFTFKNPNRVRSLFGVFASNVGGFHRADGAGYSLVGDTVRRLDETNPQVAARLAGAFSQWRRFDQARQSLMRQQLETIVGMSKLSPDVYEIVTRSLKNSSS